MRNYGYTWRGGPLLNWKHGPPIQSKAADTQALGSLGDHTLKGSTLHGATILPAPGAPEPIGVSNQAMQAMGNTVMEAMGGCSCSGTCGCGTPGPAAALSGLVDSVPGGYITLGAAALLAWHFLKKRKR